MAAARGWTRPFAHLPECRDRIIREMLADRDPEGRAHSATEISLRNRARGSTGAELAPLRIEKDKKVKRSLGARLDVVNERQIRGVLDIKMAQNLHNLVWKQEAIEMKTQDTMGGALEEVFRANQSDQTCLEDGSSPSMLNVVMRYDVLEAHWPPRVIRFTNEFGFVSGWSLDLTICVSSSRRPQTRLVIRW